MEIDGGFSCIGSLSGLSAGDEELGNPCLDVCECSGSGCRAEAERANDLWLIREGDELVGNFAGAVFDHGTSGRFLPMDTSAFAANSPGARAGVELLTGWHILLGTAVAV